MRFHYENLEVWQESMDLYRGAATILKKLPQEERYGLVDQIRRALLSVVLNIAEGSARATKTDFQRFVRQAIGSLVEADAGFKLAMHMEYFDENDYERLSLIMKSVYFKFIGLEKSLTTANERKTIQRTE